MQTKSLIFDLDGTLWDTCPSCAIGWNNVLTRNKINFRQITADDVRSVAGKPHDECIQLVFNGLSEAQIKVLIDETMNEDNLMIDLHGGQLYPFVKVGLELLRQKYRLFIVSNCQSGYIETFLKYSGLGHLFVDFECYGNTRLSKAENIKALMVRNSISSAVYIGDTTGDQSAALEAGVQFIFVNYGFGMCEGHDFQFETFFDLTKHLMNEQNPESDLGG